ncbi:hypothetical protein JOD54_002327 [Actinokineospora baliensis]|nr:hypothetical protein [Actinokineospora baliensis]
MCMDSTSRAAAILVGDVGVPFASVMTTTFLETAATTKGVEVPTGDSRGVPAGVCVTLSAQCVSRKGPNGPVVLRRRECHGSRWGEHNHCLIRRLVKATRLPTSNNAPTTTAMRPMSMA